MNILVCGATGFVGSRLVQRLSTNPIHNVRCLTRKADSLRGKVSANVQVIEGNVANLPDLVKALSGVDVAYYLIHSMEGSSKEWKKFEERDRRIAENFARAATQCNVRRIIYLGGLTNEKDPTKLSPHMRSRWEVGEILRKSTAQVTIFRAAIILGYDGGSSEMLSYLVDRLPIMVCPKWVQTKSQPVALDDVITYLVKSIEIDATAGRIFDIGGSEVISYEDMMRRYAKLSNRNLRIAVIPFLTPRLSSYWVNLVTPISASLARPLIDSLKHESIVHDDSIRELIPIETKSFEEAIFHSMEEERIARTSGAAQSSRQSLLPSTER